MRIFRSLKPCECDTAVALGYFDGIHIGHRAVIDAAVACKREGLTPTVFTFAKTPKKGTERDQLLTYESKVEMLEKLGVEILYIIDFELVREKSPEEFVTEVLKGVFGAKKAVCGYNYHFGKNGAGTGETLRKLCEKHGIDATVKAPVSVDGELVSSTKIRGFLKSGDVKSAGKMLGYDYFLVSRSIEGNHIGSAIGTPTINLTFRSDALLPKFGVYASIVTVGDKSFAGVTNIGVKPTVGEGNAPNCETWMPEYSGDSLYGKKVEVRLKEFIRPEKRFLNLSELEAAIKRDGETALGILSKN